MTGQYLDTPAPGPLTCRDWHKRSRWEARKRGNQTWYWCRTCQRWVARHPFDPTYWLARLVEEPHPHS